MTTRWLVLWLIIVAACASLLMAIAIGPARAGQCTSYDATVADIEAQGHKPFFIAPARLPKVVADAEAITGDVYGTASRGFLVVGETVTVLGLEVSGCLLDPIKIANPKKGVGA